MIKKHFYPDKIMTKKWCFSRESYKVYSGSEYGSWFGNSGNIYLAYEKNNL